MNMESVVGLIWKAQWNNMIRKVGKHICNVLNAWTNAFRVRLSHGFNLSRDKFASKNDLIHKSQLFLMLDAI